MKSVDRRARQGQLLLTGTPEVIAGPAVPITEAMDKF
jgi:hypothetical protein